MERMKGKHSLKYLFDGSTSFSNITIMVGKRPKAQPHKNIIYIGRTYYIPIHIHKNKNIIYIDHHLIALCCYQSRYQGVTFSILVALHNYNNVWGFFLKKKRKKRE